MGLIAGYGTVSFRAIEDGTPLFHSTLMSLRTVLQGVKKVHKEKKEEAFNDNVYSGIKIT